MINYSTLINIKKDNFINHYKNKRVAILLSGQIRENYYQTLMMQKLFIIDLYNADVFCSFSNDVNDEIKAHVTKILKPKYIEWVNSDNIYNINTNIKLIYNSYLMFKKIYLCNQYKLTYETENNFKYDMVIRNRPDIIINSSIPFIDLTKNILYLPDYKSFLIKIFSKIAFKTTDILAISNSYVMDRYSDIYIYFIERIKKNPNILVFPEKILENYFVEKTIKFEFVEYQFIIYKYSTKFTDLNNIKILLKINLERITEFIKYRK